MRGELRENSRQEGWTEERRWCGRARPVAAAGGGGAAGGWADTVDGDTPRVASSRLRNGHGPPPLPPPYSKGMWGVARGGAARGGVALGWALCLRQKLDRSGRGELSRSMPVLGLQSLGKKPP